MTDKYSGFSLIEMAIVLVILGILVTVIIPPFVSSVKYEKRVENKDALNSLKLSIVGYAKANNNLPASLTGAVGDTKDVWGREYEYKNALDVSICSATSNDGFHLKDNATMKDVAFALASHSRSNGESNNAEYDDDLWDFSGNDHDDIYEFVTLSQLKYLVCSNSTSDSDSHVTDLYYDPFDDDSLMQNATYKYLSNEWTVADGSLTAENSNYFMVGNATWSNCTISVDVYMDKEKQDNTDGGVALLYRADLGGYVPVGYGFQIDPGKGNRFVLRQYNTDVPKEQTLWEKSYTDDAWNDAYGTFDVSEPHTIKVKVSGNDHTLYIDDNELTTYTDDTDPIYSSGQVGLRFWGGYTATFDNLRVIKN